MERIIKFRGIVMNDFHDLYDEGEFAYGYLKSDDCISPPFEKSVRVDPNTVGQFTGLKDKNGKEIYEGDIIHVLLEDNKPKRDFIAYVLWNESYGGFQLSQYDYFMNSNCYGFEIIGNIHENPELVIK